MDRAWFALAGRLLGLGALACLLALVALVQVAPGWDRLPAPTVGLTGALGVCVAGCAAALALARPPRAADPQS
jgi:multisubunit Na+/H+ antiporter MnhG subunit